MLLCDVGSHLAEPGTGPALARRPRGAARPTQYITGALHGRYICGSLQHCGKTTGFLASGAGLD
jgi:hypothetical protein